MAIHRRVRSLCPAWAAVKPAWNWMGVTISSPMRVARTCHLCEAMCGLMLTVDGDRVTDVRGDADDVLSRGHICPRPFSGRRPSEQNYVEAMASRQAGRASVNSRAGLRLLATADIVAPGR